MSMWVGYDYVYNFFSRSPVGTSQSDNLFG